ncbi:hypothetical protein LJY25_04060 [Hymenobacter sp. BT175]|uniref:hypothetical protein n=1 Tax=Hymenobacter translucens TaxID=2886507 RepID=UPI001D0EDC6C|nr:hypothetical protein [Hymenobacter translucens]MCC2545607.1 hypothetical protein [Hymenobacter translucens]
MNQQLAVISAYIDLVDTFDTNPEAYAAVLHPDVEQTEYPSILNATIQRRNFTEILENIRLAREILADPSSP